MTPTVALALYAKACETHKRADWRLACHALAGLVREGAEDAPPAPPRAIYQPVAPITPRRAYETPGEAFAAAREPKGESLLEFLSRKGVRDDGGELSARDVQSWHKAKPFRRAIIRPDGLTLDQAAHVAWERGFFPHVPAPTMDSADNLTPVSGDDLVALISRELADELRAWPAYDPDDDASGFWEPEEMEGRAYA